MAAPRILFVSPGWPKGRLWGEMSFRFPSLSLAVVAAATPPHWETALCDEGFGPVDPSAEADVVAITAMTAQAVRAYEIADAFRSRGRTVVMGGFHASNLPDEALGHVDAVVVGEAEAVWPQLLGDFEAGRLQKVYRASGPIDTAAIPVARRSLFDGKGYLLTNTVQTTRGCPYDCEFCSVTAFFGRKYRKRPVDAVLAELQEMRKAGSFVFFVDDNIVADRTYSLRLFRGMTGMGLKWLSHASLDLAEDPELLAAAGESGCIGLFVGFETLDEDALRTMGKKTNRVAGYVDAAKALRDHGIGILGSFVLGWDGDGPDVFEKVFRFCEAARLQAGIFPILTPYPGTKVRQRLLEEGRILSSDWRDYDMEHVTFQPKGMTVEQLQEGYDRLCRQFYSFGSMWRRLGFHRSLPAFGPMNFGFRSALRRKVADA
ncbi:MAG TPA: radical SAM protein [Thermoanaerobaculia bacterium]|nr:radical SAM protein [Thermoanaerobaculia bacterium]